MELDKKLKDSEQSKTLSTETQTVHGNRRHASKLVFNVARVGVMAATLECAKLVLAALPNIEVVTLLTALFAYVYGSAGIFASVIFVCIESLVWGVNTWVLTYFLYWPFVALVFCILSKLKIQNRFILTLTAILLTVWFGVLSSLIDVGLLTGYFDNFFYRFGIYYMRGVTFYLLQISCNAVLFPLLFHPLRKLLIKSGKHS